MIEAISRFVMLMVLRVIATATDGNSRGFIKSAP